MKNKIRGGINVGTSSVLVAFVLLALVSFAALSYLSANSDYNLSLQAAKHTTEYYGANYRAEIYLANIEGLLSKNLKQYDNANDFYASLPKLFSDNDEITVEQDDDNLLRYTVVMNDTQKLNVCLKVTYPHNPDDELITIMEWYTKSNL